MKQEERLSQTFLIGLVVLGSIWILGSVYLESEREETRRVTIEQATVRTEAELKYSKPTYLGD